MKRIAIYSRKSKFTGKGDSIENQIEMCREYIRHTLSSSDENEVSVYEDEGISGKSLDRPQFKQMMMSEDMLPFDYLIVYRLDRISRNVGDFSKLIEKLNKLGTAFISIKEQFDTSTPMGRAMMNIAAVFAQLERETIAERIKDNMYQLAKSGHWTGGTTPLGYKSVQHDSFEVNGKSRCYFTLEIDEEQIDLVKLIYSKYSELQSINATEIYLNKTNNLTRNNNKWNKANVKRILENPIYCIADKDSMEYFNNLGCNVCFNEDDCDGVSGILPYNRHSGQDRRISSIDKWLITVSTHKGLLSGKEWIRIQNIIKDNSKNRYGGVSVKKHCLNKNSVLSGVLYCKCGAYMRPKMYASGKMAYMCMTKEKSKKEQCSMPNLNGNELDQLVLEELFSFNIKDSTVNKQLSCLRKRINSIEDDIAIQIKILNAKKTEIKKAINNLIKALCVDASESTIKIINNQIAEYDEQINVLDLQITELTDKDKIQTKMHSNLNNLEEAIIYLKNNFASLSIETKREFIKKIIDKVIWDGESAHIFIKSSTV